MKHLEGIALGLSMLIGTMAISASIAVGEDKNDSQQSRENSSPMAGQGLPSNRGQQVFEQNCSRCHNAPQGFSPHISGTIARHMRVRANLSEADYKALRQFLNP